MAKDKKEHRVYIAGIALTITVSIMVVLVQSVMSYLGVTDSLIQKGGWIIHTKAILAIVLGCVGGGGSYLVWTALIERVVRFFGLDPFQKM